MTAAAVAVRWLPDEGSRVEGPGWREAGSRGVAISPREHLSHLSLPVQSVFCREQG